MPAPENILFIRLKSIGDILFTLPAVNVVRENFPNSKITFLTSRENAPLLGGFRQVNDVIVIDRSRLRNPFCAALELLRVLRRLRAGKFSLVVDFQGFGETAWLAWWSGAPGRWGSIYSGGREWLFTRGVPRDDSIHQADWNLSLLEQCGLRIGKIENEFILPDEDMAAARKFFAENKLNEAATVLFIQPFTSSPQKNWPLENFIEVARHFHSRGAQIIFGGGPADVAALETVRKYNFVIAAGNPLLTSAALTKLSTLVLGGDTGLLHLAVAAGKRVVMLKSTVGNSYPFHHADWIVTPAEGKTVSEIQTETVIKACAEIF